MRKFNHAGGMTKDKDLHKQELHITYLELCLRYTEKLTKISFITYYALLHNLLL